MYTVLSYMYLYTVCTVYMYIYEIQTQMYVRSSRRNAQCLQVWMSLLESLQALVKSGQLFCYHGDELLVVWHQLHDWHSAGKVVLQKHQGTGGEGRGGQYSILRMHLYTAHTKTSASRNVHTMHSVRAA